MNHFFLVKLRDHIEENHLICRIKMVKIQFHHRPDDVSLPSLQLMRGDPPADSPPLPARSISNQREKEKRIFLMIYASHWNRETCQL